MDILNKFNTYLTEYRRNGGGGFPAGLRDQLLDLDTESLDYERDSAEVTPKLDKEFDRYENYIKSALKDMVKKFPTLDPEEDTAESIWDNDEAAYLIFMTLDGHGVGIWDGSWDHLYDSGTIRKVEAFLKQKLSRRHQGLRKMMYDAVEDTATKMDEED